MLESETDLSYERLLRLYKEVAGKSPSKGQLPFSTDWFMTWQPNIHASLFLNIHEYLNKSSELDEIDAVIKAYQLYQEQTTAQGLEALLSVTRAWRLVKFVDNGMLTHDEVLEVRRPVRHPSARDRQSTTCAACATRRRAPARARRPARSACTSSDSDGRRSSCRPACRKTGLSVHCSCLSPPAQHLCFECGSLGTRFFICAGIPAQLRRSRARRARHTQEQVGPRR